MELITDDNSNTSNGKLQEGIFKQSYKTQNRALRLYNITPCCCKGGDRICSKTILLQYMIIKAIK